MIKESPFSQRKEIENLQEQSQILLEVDLKDRHPKIVLLSTTKDEFVGIKDLNFTSTVAQRKVNANNVQKAA